MITLVVNQVDNTIKKQMTFKCHLFFIMELNSYFVGLN